jgi:hypothetical protein
MMMMMMMLLRPRSAVQLRGHRKQAALKDQPFRGDPELAAFGERQKLQRISSRTAVAVCERAHGVGAFFRGCSDCARSHLPATPASLAALCCLVLPCAAVATESVINRLEAEVFCAFLCGNFEIQGAIP